MTNKMNYMKLVPVMLAFFAMGFVDLVGIATNYVKADFGLSDSVANLLPSMVFFWFLIFSVPTGMLMSRIGQRKTVVISLAVTAVSLILPSISYTYTMMMVSFSLLGIGNALMQTSINPLISNLISGDRLASTMTFGQFVKAIASFSAPIIAAFAAARFGDWKLLYPLFMGISVVATLWLHFTPIKEEELPDKPSTFGECFSLLGDKLVLLCFIGIMCHVGIDVGTNVTAPKILMERVGMTLADAGYATSVYFLFRTVGCLTGSVILAKWSHKVFFIISSLMLAAGLVGLLFAADKYVIYACVGIIGYGNSNIFSMVFSRALLHLPTKKNDISGLMIMGIFGGTIFPLFMGYASDAMGQMGAILVMLVGAVYLLSFIPRVKQ